MTLTITIELTDEHIAAIARQVHQLAAADSPGLPLTKAEAAHALRISTRTIDRRLKAGLIKTVPDIGAIRIPLSEIDRLLKKRA